MSCVWMLQRGHSGDGCVLASTLCKYDLRKGDLFVLSWARVRRVRRGSISSELLVCGGGVRSILLLPLVTRCLETIDVCIWCMFVFMSVVVTVWGSVGIIFIIISLILSFTHLITPDEVILCTVQLVGYACLQEGPPDGQPMSVHELNGPSIAGLEAGLWNLKFVACNLYSSHPQLSGRDSMTGLSSLQYPCQ